MPRLTYASLWLSGAFVPARAYRAAITCSIVLITLPTPLRPQARDTGGSRGAGAAAVTSAATDRAAVQAERAEERRHTLLTALLTGGLTLGGVLGAQWLAANAALRQKQLELWFARKADTYVSLVEAVNEFSAAPAASHVADALNRQVHRASLFGSPAVRATLFSSDGLVTRAALLRTAAAQHAADAPVGARSAWEDALGRMYAAMQADLDASGS